MVKKNACLYIRSVSKYDDLVYKISFFFIMESWHLSYLSFQEQSWHLNMMACPTVSWRCCLLCSWTCWVWYPCCWGFLLHWRSKAVTLEICWCTQGPFWCCCPWQAGSCGTVAISRAWLPERSWGEPWVKLWTALPAPWVEGYGSPGLTAAQHRRWILKTKMNH